MTQLSTRLRKIRKEKELRQEDVANYARVNIRAYQNYERGTQEPTLSRLAKIAEILDVSMDYLVGLSDARTSSRVATEPLETLSERMKSIRRQKRLRQADVAKDAGVAIRSYQNYETGSQEPTASKLTAIARVFGVSIDALVGRDNPRKQKASSEINALSAERLFRKLPARLIQARRERGISLKDMAKSIGTDAEEYRQYEEGQKPLSAESLVKIAMTLGVSVDFLIGRTENRDVNR